MAHYAFLDENDSVVEVIVGKDENESDTDWEQWYGNFRGLTCKRTSYNSRGGNHASGGTSFRKNFAGVGYTYDSSRDAFIPPQPFPSWALNETTCLWEAPSPYPSDDPGTVYRWDETTTSWNAA